MRINERTVKVFHTAARVASHLRSPGPRDHTAMPEHMASAHRRHVEWTPARIMAAAEKVGPSTTALFEAVMAERPYPEQGFCTCLGVIELKKTYGAERLDTACRRARSINARSVGLSALHPDERVEARLPGSRARAFSPPPRQQPWADLLKIDKGKPMLVLPIHERLVALGLNGMAKAFEEQRSLLNRAALYFQ